jgi:hypothetical protein
VNDAHRNTASDEVRTEPALAPPDSPAFAPAAERSAQRDDPRDFELPAIARRAQVETGVPAPSPSEANRARPH